MLKLGGDVLPPKNPEGLKAFRECLGKAFDAHAAEQEDRKITRDGLTDVIFLVERFDIEPSSDFSAK